MGVQAKKKTRLTLLSIGLVLSLTSCHWDSPSEQRRLVKDFYLNWYFDSTNSHIILSSDGSKTNGIVVVGHTVFYVEYDESYIIAKQYPDKQEEVRNRLFNLDKVEGQYLLSDPADTIYLSPEDSFYEKNGKWYHVSNSWNPPDSLRPYKSQVIYYIIDIRNYSRRNWFDKNILGKNRDDYEVFKFESEEEYVMTRKKLGLTAELRNIITDTLLK